MIETILHCTNDKYCVFQFQDDRVAMLQPNYIAPGQDEDGYYPDAKDVISYALQMDWQEIEKDGKRMYICPECVINNSL